MTACKPVMGMQCAGLNEVLQADHQGQFELDLASRSRAAKLPQASSCEDRVISEPEAAFLSFMLLLLQISWPAERLLTCHIVRTLGGSTPLCVVTM